MTAVVLMNVPLDGPRGLALYLRDGRFPEPSLVYLGGHLLRCGPSVAIVDAKLEGLSVRAAVDRVRSLRPEIVAITAYTPEIPRAFPLAGALRESLPDAFLVLGGPHATALPEETLSLCPPLDAAAVGDGEETLERLAAVRRDRADELERVPGLVFRSGQAVRRGIAPRSTGQGRAAFHLVPRADIYYSITYRGCPFRCSFCHRTSVGVQLRDVDLVLEELADGAARGATGQAAFLDATFAIHRDRTETLLDRMVASGLSRRLRWRCATRVDLVTRDLLRHMKEAGCRGISLGIESGSDRILTETGKDTTIDEGRRAVDLARALGLETTCFFVLGHPHETRREVARTVEAVWRLNPTVACVNIMVPYPGTPVFELALRGEAGYRLLSRDYARYEESRGGALGFPELDAAYLRRMRRRALLLLHLRNLRLADLGRLAWRRTRAALEALSAIDAVRPGVRA